jgi:hypothetical protein
MRKDIYCQYMNVTVLRDFVNRGLVTFYLVFMGKKLLCVIVALKCDDFWGDD